MPANTVQSWSTKGLPAEERLDVCRAVLEAGTVPFEPLDAPDRVQAQVLMRHWGVSCAGRVEGNIGGFRRQPEHVRRSTPDNLSVTLAVRPMSVVYRGQTHELSAGDLFLYTPSDTLDTRSGDGVRLRILCIARGMLDTETASRWDSQDVVLRREDSVVGLVTSLLVPLSSPQCQAPEPAVISSLRHAGHLLSYAAGRPRSEQHRAAVAAARRAQALRLIRDQRSDPWLSPERAAGVLGCSVRYLHRLLEPTGVSFAAHLTRERLRDVQERLREGDETIADAAFAAGFGDLSTFNRAFKAHFGVTPSDARAAWRADPTVP